MRLHEWSYTPAERIEYIQRYQPSCGNLITDLSAWIKRIREVLVQNKCLRQTKLLRIGVDYGSDVQFKWCGDKLEISERVSKSALHIVELLSGDEYRSRIVTRVRDEIGRIIDSETVVGVVVGGYVKLAKRPARIVRVGSRNVNVFDADQHAFIRFGNVSIGQHVCC